ncbi:restriction endonuclease [Streptomyces nitrosporeus]|uniref:restriction endonuclease n=1 Tax=Streptomyces nitrosporeus TaxID=28894 RepID=UPI0039A1DA53
MLPSPTSIRILCFRLRLGRSPWGWRHDDCGSTVGTPDLQRVNGAVRWLYGAGIVLVVTNGSFCARCAPLAQRLRVHLVDRRVLVIWVSGGRPLWELLLRIPVPRIGR